MAAVALFCVAVLSAFVFVLFGSLLEMYKNIRQLRELAGVLDSPLEIEISSLSSKFPSDYGMPPTLDTVSSALILFLSESCSTCRILAAAIGRRLPPGVWVIIEGKTVASAGAFLEAFFDLNDSHERVLIDFDGSIAEKLGLDTTPVGFRVENGIFVKATTVPSTRYLESILPFPLGLQRVHGQKMRDADRFTLEGV